jgi:hypothetical protein
MNCFLITHQMDQNKITRDIDYFTETRMHKHFGNDFQDLLPPGKLKTEFNAVYKKENHLSLKSYRGPLEFRTNRCDDSDTLSPSFGVQEIKFWYGTSRLYHSVPIVGLFAFFFALKF